jgi:hypothetical protein
MDERTVVILENPLELAGGKTSAVIAEFQAPYENFAGIVYSELTGDHQVAVNKLQLRLATGDNEETLGKFVKPVPRPDDADEVCPRTIVLTPLEKGRYLLGCGWCNG